MEQEVNFFSDGYKLWAKLRIPDDYKAGEKRAALVECPGFRHGAIDITKMPKEIWGQGKMVERLLAEGYILLTPHCKGHGKSAGRPGYLEFPHTRYNPFDMIEDLRNGITYLQQRPEVDPDRIGTFGYSYGGGFAPYLAAVDKRIKCCVGALGVGDGTEWMRRTRRDWEFQAFKERVEADLRQQVLTGKPEFVEPLDIMILDPESAEQGGLRYKYAAIIKDLKYTLDSAHYIMNFKPVEVADKISCPLLIVGAEWDRLCPVSDFLRIYDRAKDPKKLIIIPKMTHYKTYAPENIDKLAIPLAEWFHQWLPAKQS